MADAEHSGEGLTRGAALALGAAALFGASAPLGKRLLEDARPLALSALLYLGAGLGLCGAGLARSVGTRLRWRAAGAGPGAPPAAQEAPLRRSDAGVLAWVILLGGVGGPLCMLLGLQRVSGLAGSLLLNLEAPLTVAAAVAFFGEHLGRGEALAAGLIVAGAAALGLAPGDLRVDPWGIAWLAAACGCWALDNNLSTRLSLRDPVAVVRAKALGAGSLALALALALQTPLPRPRTALLALVVGAFSYGLSLVLALRAQRLLGAARQALWFATAPFIGALLSVLLLGERPRLADAPAVVLLFAGVALLQRARHSHRHRHEALEHDHLHLHDAHHRHDHAGDLAGPHAHPHVHGPQEHEHPHASDAHHRHGHR
ncbi:MAG: DMT family transporter [Myxococcales bacterium]